MIIIIELRKHMGIETITPGQPEDPQAKKNKENTQTVKEGETEAIIGQFDVLTEQIQNNPEIPEGQKRGVDRIR